MNFGEAIKSVFSKYANFSGRASRSEYWYFILFNLIVSWGLYFVDDAISPERHVFGRIYALFVFIPGLAVMIRRLHDIGRNGLVFVFWHLLTFVLAMLSFFILTRDSILDLDSDSFFFIGLSLFLCIDVIALIVLTIIWIIWMFRDSQPGENQWGPNPKGQTETSSIIQFSDATKDETIKVNEDKLVKQCRISI